MLLQAVILIRCRVEWREVFRPLGRLKWLFLVLLVCYAVLPGDDERTTADWNAIPIFGRALWVNLGGLALAALMCLQILTVLLASSVVRLTGPGTDLVVGLRALGLPKLFVYPLDLVLAKLGGVRRPERGGEWEWRTTTCLRRPADTRILRRVQASHAWGCCGVYDCDPDRP